MKVAQICLFALFATAALSAAVVQETASDITIPPTHSFNEVTADALYLYVEEDNAEIYFYFEDFTHDEEWLVSFGDASAGITGGLSIILEEEDQFCDKVTVSDLKFTD